jgi:hypothetical protein
MEIRNATVLINKTCGVSYFYLHMCPLGLLDLWHFLFLFTYVSPRIIRPVAFLISIKKHHRSSNPRGDICK